eukprot:gene9661-8484_t
MALAIGANDVANAFGTSVGSQTLKLWQACLLAGIFEFAGAMLLGSPVADTVGFYLADIQDFLYTPEVLAYGMMCALASSAAWVTWATFMGLAISTTHSIIGGIVGFALVFNGPSGVVWEESQTGFPFHHGIVTIVLSWVITPFLSAAVASLIYLANRHLILRRNNSVKLAFLATPLLVGVTLYISLFLVLSKPPHLRGLVNDRGDLQVQGADDKLHWSLAKAAWVSAIITAGGILLIVTLGFLLIRGHISSKWLKDWSARLAGTVEATNTDPSNHTNRDPGNLNPVPSIHTNRDPSNHGNHTMSMNMFNISERHLFAEGLVSQAGWLKDWSARLAGVVEATNIDPSNHTNRDPSHHTNLDPSNHGNRDPSNRGNRDPSNHGNHTMSMYPISERPESGVIVQSSVAAQAHSSMSIVKEWITRVSTKGLHKDIFVGVTNNETVSRIHGGAENYDVETEKVYNYLLVFSACCLAFAHGGNDVANAVAPFSTIWHIYCTWSVTDETSTPTWILAVGGISMVIGLATLGYKVMRTIGVDLIMLSPSRGFSANLATALVVSLCSGLAIPVGIGMCDNLRHGTNVRLLVKTITAWLSTMVITGVMSAALFALGVFSPSQTHNDRIFKA